MAKAPGLYRPDGRPARQFGEEIVEPGEPFSSDTLSSIRALVSDETNLPNTSELPSSHTIPSPTKRASESDTPPEPHRDPLPDPHPDEPATSEIALNLPDLYAYAEDHLRTMQAMQEAAAVCPPPVEQSHHGAATRQPPQMPSERASWRHLVISEGAPGRSLRSTLGRPRFWALGFLGGLILLRPWVIPFMVLTVATAVILFVLLAGSDRVAEIAGWSYRRLKKSNPARAERLLKRGNRFLMRVPWLADILPLSWVEGFNLPEYDQDSTPIADDPHVKSSFAKIATEEVRHSALAKGT